MASLDLAIVAVYLAGVTLWGAWLGRSARTDDDYFQGRLPWFAVLLSVVATETSTLTFLSIPGIAYGGTLAFAQIAAGYVLGRIAVAMWLLPAYRQGRLRTAYELLGARFGLETRRFASGIFMVTRLAADSVRLFATAIPLSLITGLPLAASVLIIGALTFVYTYLGGIRAVVWVDASQMALYIGGGLLALAVLGPDWGQILARAGEAGKLTIIDPSFDLRRPYTLWAGLLGGAFLSMGSHGADQLIVQRLLACRDLASSRRALVGSGVAVLLQFMLFLMVGIGLWAWYDGAAFARSDEIFARFIVEALPTGARGLLIACVFAAAMSTLSSSINALSSATVYDWLRPSLRAGRAAAAVWSALLVAAALGFMSMSGAAIEVALGIASLVYGGLLGAFALARFSRRATSTSVRVGIAAGIAVVTAVWALDLVAWPWFALLGTAVTFTLGGAARGRRGRG